MNRELDPKIYLQRRELLAEADDFEIVHCSKCHCIKVIIIRCIHCSQNWCERCYDPDHGCPETEH